MKVVIPTQVTDTHALAVMMALQQKGHDAVRWFVADFPNKQTASVELKNKEIPTISVAGVDFTDNMNDVDVVWFRRPTLPIAPVNIHDDDIEHAITENSVFFHSVWSLLSDQAVWINPFQARKLARSKLYQLRAAQRAGFLIPDTLVSNNPSDIRRFLVGDSKIFKPFRVAEWQTETGTALLQTSLISTEEHFSDISLQATVGIYQNRIEKDYELRINYFGGKIIAVQLLSQTSAKSTLDWRAATPEELKPTMINLPPEIITKCHALMIELGLVFGCIDIIVTPNGSYTFLEVNEMGQFLWIERANPDIRILDAFCDFLLTANGKNDSVLAYSKRVSYCDIVNDSEFSVLLKKDITNHNKRNPAMGLAEWYI